MHTYKFVIEYAGTRYSGWQEQKNALTVAGELRRALQNAEARVVEIGGAGRTDAGVHAVAQVAHVRLETAIDPSRLMRDVNANLPADVNVLSVDVADARFHARHHAISRSYVYQIAERRTAFAKRHVWWIEDALDTDLMRAACAMCVGEHDFALFCDRAKDQTSTSVRMDQVELAKSDSMILLRFEASHFLWRMVRRLTGAIVLVGRHELDVSQFRATIDAELGADHTAFEKIVRESTAPASGLFLESVRYPRDRAVGALVPLFPIEMRAQ
ncbi:MAG: tRNA pseudouridine(38-40) synthase TruA [Planctomycetota bacterium]|nr:tRNA pseudouridine(38-40) synthase TruA [Planctomycetota bacterium]